MPQGRTLQMCIRDRCIKEIQHPKSEQDQRKQIFRYNSIVIGMHNYYCLLYTSKVTAKVTTNQSADVTAAQNAVTYFPEFGYENCWRLLEADISGRSQAIEFIAQDELIEVTPKNIRMRKRILDKSERMKAWSKNKGQ